MHHSGSWGWIDQVHLGLALTIAAAYMSVPFTALRRLAKFLPTTATVSGSLFFLTCALTHLSLATGLHSSHWMVISDAVQAVSIITFLAALSRMVGRALDRRSQRAERAAHHAAGH